MTTFFFMYCDSPDKMSIKAKDLIDITSMRSLLISSPIKANQFTSKNHSYSSSSNWNTSLEDARISYSSLEPTIMFSNSRKPVPAGIR